MNKNRTLKQASQLIQSAHRPLLICHLAPDGDAIGSMVGLCLALRRMGMEPTMACSDPVLARFSYVTDTKSVVQRVDTPFDLVITLDCSDLERLGHLAQIRRFGDSPLLNIDHHLTNLNFGDVNLVDAYASSTAEIVFRLLEYMAVPLDTAIATGLLTGIVTDTRGFRTSNVTVQVMKAAQKLMEAGASLPHITQHSLDRRPTAAILLWREALASLQISNHVAWASISLAMRHTAGYVGNGDAGLVSFLISAEDADIAAVFVERKGDRVEVGLRALPGFDVAQVALGFGGGGHALAAGCTISGSLEEVQTQVLATLLNITRNA